MYSIISITDNIGEDCYNTIFQSMFLHSQSILICNASKTEYNLFFANKGFFWHLFSKIPHHRWLGSGQLGLNNLR